MRNFSIPPVLAAALGIGLLYGLDDRWWVALFCGIVGIMWSVQVKFHLEWIRSASLLLLAGAVGAGVFLGYSRIWLLTDIVILLIAWDLDRFTWEIQPFARDRVQKDNVPALFKAHLLRLGIVAVLGWSLGVVGLTVQVSINFITALAIGVVALLGLLQALRYLNP